MLTYGERIRIVRCARNWSQRELGRRCGVSQFPINQAEQALSQREVKPDLQRAIIAAFGGLDLYSPEVEAAFAILRNGATAAQVETVLAAQIS